MNHSFITGIGRNGLAFLRNEAGVEIPVHITRIDHRSVDPTLYTSRYTCEEIHLWPKENPYLKKNPAAINLTIDKVIFNDPATIVFWSDGIKTVVKTQNGETFDPEKGLAMAIAKRAFGNKGNYFNHISKWVDKYNVEHPVVEEETIVKKTYAIKCGDTCMRCVWSLGNSGCSTRPCCEDCPHNIEGKISCKCSLVDEGAPCPYFEKVKNT